MPLRFLTAGESHGPEVSVILDGVPAGLALPPDRIDALLARRQKGFGAGARMRIESDRVSITGGVMAGRTTGAPLAMRIRNVDADNWDREIDPLVVPRPGHADLVGALKFGHDDLRLSLERASARETAARVCAGAVCLALLDEVDIQIGAYVVRIGAALVELPPTVDAKVLQTRARIAQNNDVGCPLEEAVDDLRAEIKDATQARDTVGGMIESFATGVPPGLGSYVQWDRRLDARLGAAMLSIPAMKAVEIGAGFASAAARGTEVHDEISAVDGELIRTTNRCGGLEGGVTTGSPLIVRVAKKPISSTLTPLNSVDLVTGEGAEVVYERSDICAVPRAVPVIEAMLAWVVLDALLEKVGGDSIGEVRERTAALPRGSLEDLNLHGRPWRFDDEPHR